MVRWRNHHRFAKILAIRRLIDEWILLWHYYYSLINPNPFASERLPC